MSALELSETTNTTNVNAFLIFESCEEKLPRINGTLYAMRTLFGQDYAMSSICILTGCADVAKKKIGKRQGELI